MKITVIGASGGEVTGSAYVLQTKKARIMVDCGMFQGGKAAEAKNRIPESVNRNLDAVLLTHGHLDHTGRLPLLSKLGYKGSVYATGATREMAGLILRDCARIISQDLERHNRRRARKAEQPREPLFTAEDAEDILSRFTDVPYKKPVLVAPGIYAMWVESGHMLGSASIQLLVEDEGVKKKIVFSGDIGPRGAPILRDFETFHDADLVFLESTYGDHDHRSFKETVGEFVEIVKEATETGGKILVPTFAVGRAQLLTLLLSWMFRKKHVKPFPTFLDSPMAIQALKIYTQHFELFDDEMLAYIKERPLREDLKMMQLTSTAKQSMGINAVTGTALVMAGAGMCNAGRILHHLRNNLWKPETHVMIVGYQANGSLGRQLVEGQQFVNIHGDKIAVKAHIHTMGGFSAHAGQTDLMAWFDPIAPSKPRVVLTHGEDGPRSALSALIEKKYKLKPVMPAQGDVIEV